MIAVIIKSRNNPFGFCAVVHALVATAAAEADYHAIIDEDDTSTIEMADVLGVTAHVGSGNIHQRDNDVATTLALNHDWITTLPDDMFTLTQHWDQAIASVKMDEHPVIAWEEANDPNNMTMPIFSSRWLKASGRMFPEHFPFWFADTWVKEVHELVFGTPVPMVSGLRMGGARGKTQGMHDLKFWFDFFAATRCERFEEAERICLALGLKLDIKESVIDQHLAYDRFQQGRISLYERTFGANQGVPSERYVRAKEEADAWLEQHRETEAA